MLPDYILLHKIQRHYAFMVDTLIFKVVDIDLHGKRPAHIFLIDDLFRRTVFTGAVTVEYQRLVGYFQCVLGIMGVHYGRYATLFRKVFNGIKDYELVFKVQIGLGLVKHQHTGSMVSALAISTI